MLGRGGRGRKGDRERGVKKKVGVGWGSSVCPESSAVPECVQAARRRTETRGFPKQTEGTQNCAHTPRIHAGERLKREREANTPADGGAEPKKRLHGVKQRRGIAFPTSLSCSRLSVEEESGGQVYLLLWIYSFIYRLILL